MKSLKIVFFIIFYKIYKDEKHKRKYRMRKRILPYFILAIVLSPITIIIGGFKLFLSSLLSCYKNWDRTLEVKNENLTWRNRIAMYGIFSRQGGYPFHLWSDLN